MLHLRLGYSKAAAILILIGTLVIVLVIGFSLFNNPKPNLSANAAAQTTSTMSSPSTPSGNVATELQQTTTTNSQSSSSSSTTQVISACQD